MARAACSMAVPARSAPCRSQRQLVKREPSDCVTVHLHIAIGFLPFVNVTAAGTAVDEVELCFVLAATRGTACGSGTAGQRRARRRDRVRPATLETSQLVALRRRRQAAREVDSEDRSSVVCARDIAKVVPRLQNSSAAYTHLFLPACHKGDCCLLNAAESLECLRGEVVARPDADASSAWAGIMGGVGGVVGSL